MTTSTKAILLALALCTASVPAVDAATIRVANNGLDTPTCGQGPKAPCRSISRGLALAADGDTIEVGPGLYGDIDADGQFTSPGDEPAQIGTGCECMIHVTKVVTLVSRSGATQTLIHPGPGNRRGDYGGAGYSALVQIDAAGAVFGQKDRGFTVASKAVPAGGDGLTGIRIGELAAGASIGGNFVAMNELGIFSSAPGLVISDNLIQTNTVGVMMEGGHEALISGNAVQGNNVGLGLLGLDMTITGNIITGNRYLGVTLHGGTGHTMSGNSILGNGVGVLLQTNAEAAVHGNNIFGNDTTQVPSANAGLISNSTFDLDISGNYWGAPATSGFAGDDIYNLGTGSLEPRPTAKARFTVALQPMK